MEKKRKTKSTVIDEREVNKQPKKYLKWDDSLLAKLAEAAVSTGNDHKKIRKEYPDFSDSSDNVLRRRIASIKDKVDEEKNELKKKGPTTRARKKPKKKRLR